MSKNSKDDAAKDIINYYYPYTAIKLHKGQTRLKDELRDAWNDDIKQHLILAGNGFSKTTFMALVMVNLCANPDKRMFTLPWFKNFDDIPRKQWAIRLYATRTNIIPGGAVYNAIKELDKSVVIQPLNKLLKINNVSIQLYTHDMLPKQSEGANLQLILSDEPQKEEIFNASVVRLRHKAGPNIYMCFGTPVDMNNGYLLDYLDDPMWHHFEGTIYENPHLPQDYIKRVEKMCEINPDERDPRLFGKFASLQGAVFKTFNRQEHIIKSLPISEYKWYLGIDPHQAKQCFAVLLAVDANHQVYVVDNYPNTPWDKMKSSSLSIQQQVDHIHQMCAKHTDTKPIVYGDKLGFRNTFNTQQGQSNNMIEYAKAGLTIISDPVVMDWQYRKECILQYLYYDEETQPAIRICEHANNIINALQKFAYKNTGVLPTSNFNSIIQETWECPISALSFPLTTNLKGPTTIKQVETNWWKDKLNEKYKQNDARR